MNNNETNLNLKCSYLSDRNVSISEQGLRKTHKLMKKKTYQRVVCPCLLEYITPGDERGEFTVPDSFSHYFILLTQGTWGAGRFFLQVRCQHRMIYRHHNFQTDMIIHSLCVTPMHICIITSASELSSPLQGFVIGKKYKISVVKGTYNTLHT